MMTKKAIIITLISVAALAIGIFVFYTTHNSGLIKQKTLAHILADIYIVDAMGQNKGNLYKTSNPDRYMENSYHTLLSRYGTTKVIFDSTMNWYAEHPEEFSLLYDDVIGLLSEKEGRMTLLLNKRDSISKRITNLRDSLKVNYWDYAKTIRLPLTKKDTVPDDLLFEYETDSIQHGKIHFDMSYVFPRRNKAKDSAYVELVICYNDTIADTTSLYLEKHYSLKQIKIAAEVRDTLPATKVKARLLKSKELKQTTATFSNITLYYMPYEITDSVQFDEIQLPSIFTF